MHFIYCTRGKPLELECILYTVQEGSHWNWNAFYILYKREATGIGMHFIYCTRGKPLELECILYIVQEGSHWNWNAFYILYKREGTEGGAGLSQ